jgi:hypothetical protein
MRADLEPTALRQQAVAKTATADAPEASESARNGINLSSKSPYCPT